MENFIALVKYSPMLKVEGMEGLSIGESFNTFFKEFSLSIDKRMAVLSKSVHKVDYNDLLKRIKSEDILYVQKTGIEILTPQGFRPGLAAMAAHVKAIQDGVFVICTLKAEAGRLYAWLKEIVKTGRMDRSFKWTITEFETTVNDVKNFIKNLPSQDKKVTFALGSVYTSWDEMFDVMHTFNTTVDTVGARDIENMSRELSNVYDLGSLLVDKIKSSDILISEIQMADIENVVNRFIELTNLAGASMVLMNEMTAVLTAQVATLSKM